MKKTLIIAVLLLIIDIISKWLVQNLLLLNQSVEVIGNFFNLTYVKNTGAAFSIFTGQKIVLIGVFLYYINSQKITRNIEIISYGLVLGGALGNLIDRICYGYVIDFLDFNLFGYNYPIFNLADCFIVIGFILLIIDTFLKKEKNDI